MTVTWNSDAQPPMPKVGMAGWARIVARATPILVTIGVGLAVLFAIRVFERPLFGVRRPVSPWVTQVVCRASLVWMGLRFERSGTPVHDAGALVANHSSWLDIFALNAADRLYFVSKAEVAGWPGIGFLARSVGTVFIARDRRQAHAQRQLFVDLLGEGQRLLFFPEGTSTDGLRVLPFKPTLFDSFFEDRLRSHMIVQPITVIYHAPDGADARSYGWWGDMEFGPHLLATLALPRHGKVEVIYHPHLRVSDFSDRKALAAAAETAVRDGHTLANGTM